MITRRMIIIKCFTPTKADHIHQPASKELKHQDAQRPEVHTEVVAFVENDLRRHVLRCPAEGPGLLTTSDLLGKTKVNLGSSR